MANETHFELSDDLGEWIQGRTGDFLTQDDTQENDGEDTPTAGILTAFVLTCEWVGDDGGKWLTYHRKNDQAVWLSRGLLSESLVDLPT